jgi:hypothetical protein
VAVTSRLKQGNNELAIRCIEAEGMYVKIRYIKSDAVGGWAHNKNPQIVCAVDFLEITKLTTTGVFCNATVYKAS